MLFPYLFVAALGLAVVGDIYDVTLTSRGLKKGLAVESNDWLVGEKPSAKSLYLRDALVLAMAAAPSLAAFAVGNVPVAIGGLSTLIVYAVKHYSGGRAWKKLGA